MTVQPRRRDDLGRPGAEPLGEVQARVETIHVVANPAFDRGFGGMVSPVVTLALHGLSRSCSVLASSHCRCLIQAWREDVLAAALAEALVVFGAVGVASVVVPAVVGP